MNSCTKTATFRKKIDAKIALAQTRYKDRGEVRYYYCSQHKGYHLTSQKQ